MAGEPLGARLVDFLTEAQDADDREDETEESPPLALYADEPACYSPLARPKEAPSGRQPLDWATLASQTPPDRAWAIPHWLPMAAVTLLSGAAGAGKSLVAQAVGSCLALHREYLD